ncbi:MAG: cobyric acid synthase [Pseudomonadota bacterium]
MFQGTGSDVGKSLIVAGLARYFHHQGLRVAPFKPQNMSNNAHACTNGGEIGRAQALQARAAKIDATCDMNPILLKPEPDHYCQIIVQGKLWKRIRARDYAQYKPQLRDFVMEAFARLSRDYDLVLCEGAGSVAEVNLRQDDIANMGFAKAANVPVILVGDIDRGGVIAAIAGTRTVLTQGDAQQIKGFIINKFRGDATLFQEALQIITDHSGWHSLGVVPWFDAAGTLPAEDSLGLYKTIDFTAKTHLRIAVPHLPHIANFDDFDPLHSQENVTVRIIPQGDALPQDADLLILPGSKSTLSDLRAVKACGWHHDIYAHYRQKKPIIGLCGGYQMLGCMIADPQGIEGPVGEEAGLGLLRTHTILTQTKAVTKTSGADIASGIPLTGYEIHCGQTTGEDCANPWVRMASQQGTVREDGAISADGLVRGCYMHGIFASDSYRTHLLRGIKEGTYRDNAHEYALEDCLDQLAAHLGQAVDMARILAIAGPTDSS